MSEKGTGEQLRPELTADELQFIINHLYGSKWSGPEWHQTIVPLLDKMAGMIKPRDIELKTD